MKLLQLEVPFEATSPTCVTVTVPPQPSVAVTELMSGGGTSEKHGTVTGAGHVIDGMLDRVMVWVQVAVCPCAFIAVHVRVVIGPAQFEPVTVSTKRRRDLPRNRSEKVGMPVTEGSMGPGQGTVMSGGQVPVGGDPPATVKVTWQVFRTPPPKSRMTRTTTEPEFEVVTVTLAALRGEARVGSHERRAGVVVEQRPRRVEASGRRGTARSRRSSRSCRTGRSPGPLMRQKGWGPELGARHGREHDAQRHERRRREELRTRRPLTAIRGGAPGDSSRPSPS